MSTLAQMNALFQSNASSARYYRSSGRSLPCPCRTPEGFRDPELHLSFAQYGVESFSVSSGVIPAGTQLRYTLVAIGSNGVAMSPAVVYPPLYSDEITDAQSFQVSLAFNWPPGEAFVGGNWAVYRSENGDSPTLLGTLDHPSTTFVDNYPLGSGSVGLIEPVLCNEAGEIPQTPIDMIVKAFVQPIQSTRATRLSTEYLQEVFGTIEADDHLGIFPVTWSGNRLDFRNWGQHGEDFIEYDGQRFFVINANMIPDPGNGDPEHHWETGLRLIREDGLVS